MNGNTPYGGTPTVTPAGKRASADISDPAPDQIRRLQENMSEIAAETRKLLPNGYLVNTNVGRGATGVKAQIAVRPPAGRPVSAGFSPSEDELQSSEIIDTDDQTEVARGLAASAILQVKQAVSSDITSVAR
ncbi:hypothetical protein K0C01_01655 [Salinarchaeum sp. IM2453]|uniref:DUF5811 family protein n=1 Tax=Salinarchaeum sp. IM2453 TaxID=2862870 RepID=UPI001C83A26B|nr:DUF5811 family protein [Salinarchaeum sp. IM2453]QZA88899.1 hypothetical protein K0C01_01655 [Salinarchaeum sp. IM2453]